ncbi:MAG: EpsG family protein [Bacteroidales bacterium]|nr:EpsG family protein [Bacteroidales bacterium]
MEIDFIPVLQYTHYFHVAVLCLILLAFWQCASGSVLKQNVAEFNAGWGFVLAVLITLYIGLRPVNTIFGDTVNYASGFNSYKDIPFSWQWNREWLFQNLMHWFARFSNINMFFLFCAAVYVLPLWIAMHRIFKNYSYLPFLVIIAMFSFWTYGINGIRNGMGASLIILAITYIENLPIMAILCILAFGIHNSVALMIVAALLAWFVNNSYYYLFFWVLCVIASYFFGDIIQAYIASIGFGGDDRFTNYLTMTTEEYLRGEGVYVRTGWRWDFLVYSSMAVVVGWYFVFRRKFHDDYYHWLYNSFLITNAFWVLIIRAAYSNRFAQISWFIMPIVLIYPFMKKRFWLNHEKMLGYAILIFYAFAFYSNILRG